MEVAICEGIWTPNIQSLAMQDNLMEHLTGTYPLRGCVSIFRWACRIGRFGFEQKLELIVLNWLNNLNSLILGLRSFAFCWANSFGPAGKA